MACLILRLVRHRVAGKVGCAFRRRVHRVPKNASVVRAVVSGGCFTFRTRLAWALVLTASNKILMLSVSRLAHCAQEFCQDTHLSVSSKVNLQCLAVILESKGRHGE